MKRRWFASRRVPAAAKYVGVAVLIVAVWYAFNGIGPWRRLNQVMRARTACHFVRDNPDGSQRWRCKADENPNHSAYDSVTDHYFVRSCTFVRADEDDERPDIYRCHEEEG